MQSPHSSAISASSSHVPHSPLQAPILMPGPVHFCHCTSGTSHGHAPSAPIPVPPEPLSAISTILVNLAPESSIRPGMAPPLSISSLCLQTSPQPVHLWPRSQRGLKSGATSVSLVPCWSVQNHQPCLPDSLPHSLLLVQANILSSQP